MRKVKSNKWECIRIAKKKEMIKVIWDHRNCGKRTEYCKVIFEDKKEGLYRLEAPGLVIIIAQACINEGNISFENVSMESISK